VQGWQLENQRLTARHKRPAKKALRSGATSCPGGDLHAIQKEKAAKANKKTILAQGAPARERWIAKASNPSFRSAAAAS
jgi:hypothetical protein